MARIKATRYMLMRNLIQERGPEFARRFRARLDPKERERLDTSLPVSWVDFKDIPAQGDMVTVAADMFFPGRADGIQQVAAMLAKAGLSGIYKIFLMIPSVEFVIHRVAKLWHTYNDTGDASVEDFRGTSGTIVVRQFPDMPPKHRQYLEGYIAGVLELTRAKNIKIDRDETDPQAWKWNVRWS